MTENKSFFIQGQDREKRVDCKGHITLKEKEMPYTIIIVVDR